MTIIRDVLPTDTPQQEVAYLRALAHAMRAGRHLNGLLRPALVQWAVDRILTGQSCDVWEAWSMDVQMNYDPRLFIGYTPASVLTIQDQGHTIAQQATELDYLRTHMAAAGEAANAVQVTLQQSLNATAHERDILVRDYRNLEGVLQETRDALAAVQQSFQSAQSVYQQQAEKLENNDKYIGMQGVHLHDAETEIARLTDLHGKAMTYGNNEHARYIQATDDIKRLETVGVHWREETMMYANAWQRELRGNHPPKVHLIDSLVLGTRALWAQADDSQKRAIGLNQALTAEHNNADALTIRVQRMQTEYDQLAQHGRTLAADKGRLQQENAALLTQNGLLQQQIDQRADDALTTDSD